MAFRSLADEPFTDVEYMRGKAPPQSLPAFGYNMQAFGKPSFEEICSIWDENPFGPSKASSASPESVLAPLHSDSPPLDSEESPPSPFELDVEQMEFLFCNIQADENCSDEGHLNDMITSEDQTMQESYDSHVYHHKSYLYSPDKETHSGKACDEHTEEDAQVTDSLVEKSAKSSIHGSKYSNIKHDITSQNNHGENHAHTAQRKLVVAPAPIKPTEMEPSTEPYNHRLYDA